MTFLRTGALLVALALPCAAKAQSFYAFQAEIAPEGEAIGSIYAARISVRASRSPTRPVAHYADRDLELDATVDLESASTQIAAGVGAPTQLIAEGWSISMSAGTWAPLRALDATAASIALPSSLPVRAAQIPRGARQLAGAPHAAFTHAGAPARWRSSCEALELRAAPASASPRWHVPAGTAFRQGSDGAVDVWIDGFVVHAFSDVSPAHCVGVGTLGAHGTGMGCGDGSTQGIVVRVPAGTPLYATASSARPFGRLRREVIGREVIDGPIGTACSAGRCDRVPPLPRGSGSLLFDRDASASGDWSFVAHVRLPIERLPRVRGAGGFGACFTSPDDWPEAPGAR